MKARVMLGLLVVMIEGGPSLAQATAKDPSPAVDALVKQLRRYPARPSTAAESMGIHLIDAMGGETTLIANEPEPWLTYCDWPSWSPDGRTIVYSARRDQSGIVGVRLKALDLAQGRLELRDLGSGGWPSFSPTSDRILATYYPPGQTGRADQAGLWLMGTDGSHLAPIGGFASARWSPNLEQFMTVQAPPTVVTIVNVRPEKSGVLLALGFSLLSPPSWAGEDLLVAAIAADDGEALALVDVANPPRGEIREILWKRAKGPDVSPALPVYSPVTRRCVFVGLDQDKKPALYGFTHGKPDPPQRLEKQALDTNIEDLTFSPDGRYVLFGGNRREAPRAGGARARSVDAPALSGITIDGDLKDWPVAMPRHAIENLAQDPAREFEAGADHISLSTSADLSACFSVGYDPKEQLILIAVIVRDDKLVVGNSSPVDTDSVEIYVDGRHGTVNAQPQGGNWESTIDAGELPVLHYAGIPGEGRVYGIKLFAGEEREAENPILFHGDVTKTKTKMAFRRAGDVTTYEWAIQAFDHYPDQPTKLAAGVQIGLDIEIRDKDAPNRADGQLPREEVSTQICWATALVRRFKVFSPTLLGEIVLGRAPKP